MMQNRLKDRDRGGYTSDRYRPHDNYTNAFNMLAQIGLAEKEVTNSMRNAVTQAANVKALQDRLKFDVSSYSAKLKQSALDYNTGQQMMYENLIQTYIESKEDERRKKLEKWAKDNENNYKNNKKDFEKAFNAKVDEYKKTDIEAAKKQYEKISNLIDSYSKAMQKHIEEFDDVFSLYPNNSDKAILDSINSHLNDTKEYDDAKVFSPYPNNSNDLDNKIKKWTEDSQDNHYNDSASIKAVTSIKAVKDKIKEVYGIDIDTAKEKEISDNINNYSDVTKENIEEFDDALSFYSNYSNGLDNDIKKWAEDSQNNYYNDSAFKKAYEMDIKEKDKAIKRLRSILDSNANPFDLYPNKTLLDSINNHSNKTQEYIGEFDYAAVRKIIGLSIKKTNAIIGEFFKNFFGKGGE